MLKLKPDLLKEVRRMKTLEQRLDELEKRVAELEARIPEQPELKNDYELDFGRPKLLKPRLKRKLFNDSE